MDRAPSDQGSDAISSGPLTDPNLAYYPEQHIN